MREKSRALYDFIEEIYEKFSRDHGSFLAAAISYYALLSIFPLLLVMISAAGFFVAKGDTTNAALIYVHQIMPQFDGLIRDNIRSVVASRGQVGLIGILGLLWSGTAVFDALEYALDEIWGENKAKLLFRAKLLGVVTVVGLGTVLVVITLAEPLLVAAENYLRQAPLGRAIFSSYDLYFWLVSLLMAIGVFLVLYRFGPSRRPTFKEVWPGALAAGIIWELAKRLFSWYLRNVAKFSAIYGSMGIIVGLLVWLYVLGIIVILGGELAVILKSRKKRAAIDET